VNNCESAILDKVNELAERWGIKPYDFIATVGKDADGHNMVLTFESQADATHHMLDSFCKMLVDLHVPDDDNRLVGSGEGIYKAIEHALECAPKHRLRPRSR